jgi:hypothetical protein
MRGDQSCFRSLFFQEFARLGHFGFFEIVSGDYGHPHIVFILLSHHSSPPLPSKNGTQLNYRPPSATVKIECSMYERETMAAPRSAAAREGTKIQFFTDGVASMGQ